MRVAEQQAAVMAAGLLDKKESEDNSSVIGPSMPDAEPSHTEVYHTNVFSVYHKVIIFVYGADTYFLRNTLFRSDTNPFLNAQLKLK